MNKYNRKLKLWLIITLCCAIVAFSIPIITATYSAENEKDLVIVLDPGHGGPDFGAINKASGLYESEINLKIALACKEELERYDGVVVYMTHTGLDPNKPKLSLTERVDFANSVDADILISLHTNDAESDTANGSEVYVSHSTYKAEYNAKSTELAISFLRQFRAMGMTIRGVKTRLSNGSRVYVHSDGSEEIGDYYAVIGDSIRRYAIPGMLVEHGFIKGDSEKLDTDEELKLFGIADATAIAEYYGLELRGEGDSSQDDDVPVYTLTDAEREAAQEVSQLILKLPQDVLPGHEEQILLARERYEQLSVGQKSTIETDVSDSLYHSVIALEYAKHPVRLSEVEGSELFIDRINGTISADGAGYTAGAPSVQTLLSSLELYSDTTLLERVLREQAPAELAAAYAATLEETESEEAQALIAAYVPTEEEIAAWVATKSAAQLDGTRYSIAVLDANGALMTGEALCATGCSVAVYYDGAETERLTYIMYGDISGDGIIDSLDHLCITRHIKGIELLSATAQLAADLNSDGFVTAEDEAVLSKMIVSEY